MVYFIQRTGINSCALKTTNVFFSATTIICCFLYLAGCTSQASIKNLDINPTPRVTPGSFQNTVQQGVASTIKISADSLSYGSRSVMHFSLIPSGPYISHRLALNYQPLALTSDGEYAYVATGSKIKNQSNLLIVQFTADGKSTILNNNLVIDDVITKLTYKNKHLVLALKQGGIKIIDVSNPTLPAIRFNFPTISPVLDIHQGNHASYLLLENNSLLKISHKTTRNKESTKKPSNFLFHEWKLPIPANSIAARNNFIWLTGPKGIASVELSNSKAVLIDLYKTSGTPLDIQLNDDLALVADGPGGLAVFNIAINGKLQWLGSYNKRDAITSLSTAPVTTNFKDGKNILITLANGSVMTIGINHPELPGSGVTFKPEHPALATTLFNTPNKSSPHTVALLATENSLLRTVMTGNNKQLISPEGVNQGGSRRGIIRDNILYVADWFSGLHLYDVSNPEQVKHLSSYHTPGSSKGVTLMDNYALVGDDDQGLQIINIKNPHKPRWVSELAPEALSGMGLAYTMKLVNKTLYLADHRGGFHIIDLSDIHHPKRLGGYNTPGKSWGIDVFKNFVFVADDASGLLIFDSTNVSKPELVGQFNPDGQAEDVLINNNLAYVTFFDKGLYILDISQPHAPKILGHTAIPGNARGLVLEEGLVYVAGWESGLHIIDISNPETPHIISSYDTNGAAWGVNIKNGVAFVLDWWGGIKMIDVQQPTNPVFLSQYHARDSLQQLRSKNKYLFAASLSGGLQVFDIKNPLNPIWTTGIDFKGSAQDIWLDDDRAYVAAGDGGIIILDTLDPFYTRLITSISTPGDAINVRAWNEVLYIQDTLAGLIVMDVRDPHHPQEIARYPMQFRDLWVDENTLWVNTTQGLMWWNHGDSGALTNNLLNEPKNLLTMPGSISYVRSQNDLVATAHNDGVIKLWRKTTSGLASLGQYITRESVSDIQLTKDTLYVLGERSGLMAININNPETPRLTALYPATGKHSRFEIAQGAAFFAGDSRLASVTLLPSTVLTSKIIPHTDRSNDVEILLPDDLPIGEYHLLATTPGGQKTLLPNALNVQFSAPNQGKSPLEAMRQMLKGSLKPPKEP